MRFDKFLTLVEKYETMPKEDLEFILNFSFTAAINDFKDNISALWRYFYLVVNDVAVSDVNFLLKRIENSIDLSKIKDAFSYVESFDEEEISARIVKEIESKGKQTKLIVVSFISSFCALRNKKLNLKYVYELVKKEEL